MPHFLFPALGRVWCAILYTWWCWRLVWLRVYRCRRSHQVKAQQLLRRSKSIFAEWKLNSVRQHSAKMYSRETYYRPNGPHFPDRCGYRQSRSIISIVPYGHTYQAQHGIGFSISLHQTRHQSGIHWVRRETHSKNPIRLFSKYCCSTTYQLCLDWCSTTYLYGLLGGLYISKSTFLNPKVTYAFLPIHRHRLSISIHLEGGMEGLRGEAKKSYLSLALTTDDSKSTYIANNTSSHVIPILFLTRIDQPDSIWPRLISSTIGDVAGWPLSLIPIVSAVYEGQGIEDHTFLFHQYCIALYLPTYGLGIIIVNPNSSKHGMLPISPPPTRSKGTYFDSIPCKILCIWLRIPWPQLQQWMNLERSL
jgi:hypothetical protein